MSRKITALCLIFFCFTLKAYADQAQEKLRKVQDELKQKRLALEETKEKERETLGRLVVITKELDSAKTRLNLTDKKIVKNSKEIEQLSLELKQDEDVLGHNRQKFSRHLNEAYKSSGINYLEVVLSSASMSDFLNRLYYFGKIMEQDAGLIEQLAETMARNKKRKNDLNIATRQAKDLRKQVAAEKETIHNKVLEKQAIYETLKQRRIRYEQEVTELERNSKELEQVIQRELAERARKGQKAPRGSGQLAWPLSGRITSVFGWRRHPIWGSRNWHTGIDIAAPYGRPIAAADSGEVILSKWWKGYGKAVVIDHGRGVSTVYGHMSRIYVKYGDQIRKGQIIGLVGSTGYSTGPHLHFEVRINGKPVDPNKYL